jgi:hypothetical protein
MYLLYNELFIVVILMIVWKNDLIDFPRKVLITANK